MSLLNLRTIEGFCADRDDHRDILEVARATGEDLHHHEVFGPDHRDLHAGDQGRFRGADEQLLEARPREHDIDRHARRLVNHRHDSRRRDERVVERERWREPGERFQHRHHPSPTSTDTSMSAVMRCRPWTTAAWAPSRHHRTSSAASQPRGLRTHPSRPRNRPQGPTYEHVRLAVRASFRLAGPVREPRRGALPTRV
jgi:hypothetical protein